LPTPDRKKTENWYVCWNWILCSYCYSAG